MVAKRYKENKKKKIKPFFLIIIIIGLIILFFIINKKQFLKNEINNIYKESVIEKNNEYLEENNEENEEIEKNNCDIKLSSNLVLPEELEKEVISNLDEQFKEAELVKIQYRLKSLDNGEIELFYKVSEKIIKTKIDISKKSIVNIEEIQDKELSKKSKIQDNIKEDIKKVFEENEELLNEEKVLNIIITDTEVILSISYI